MIQGGGFTPDFQQKPTYEAIVSEANNRLKNKRGTVAMARTGNPHSATAQFFINVRDNNFLDYAENASEINWGYTVFGKVIKGMEVADEIQKVKTGSRGPFRTDVPLTTVTIEKMFVVRAND
jgi:cyclophilin family peptidyl-prolyl cis-trans isomerase